MWSPLDGLFGPQLPGEFDFTLLFEHVMLTIVPGGIVVLAIPFYLRITLQAMKRVRPGFLLWLKLAVGLVLLATHTTSLVMWKQASSVYRSDVALSAAIMSLIASIAIMVILYIAHTYSLQPSAFLSIFLTITALFDITMTRSYFLRAGLDTIGSLQIAVVTLKIVLVVLEEVPKRDLFRTEQLRSSTATETVAGFWNRAVFGWLNPLMLHGYKKDLKMEDLPSIDDGFNSMELYGRFSPNWNRVNQASKFGLVKALLLTVPWQAAKVVPPRLLFVGFTVSQPFLLFRIVDAVKDGDNDDISHGLIGATAIIFTGIAVTRGLYEHMMYRMSTSIRGILVVAIYDKMCQLPIEELNKSAAVTLMTTDVVGVEQILSLAYQLWSSTILVSLGTWSLSLYVGKACFLMLIPGIGSFIASNILGKNMIKARAAWNGDIEARVALTSNILAQIKGIKSMGLSGVMTEHLQEKRRSEIKTSMQERHIRIWQITFAALTYVLSPVGVLAGAYFWTRVAEPLTAAEIFTVLAIVEIASNAFISLLHGMVRCSTAVASLWRIQTFLCLCEVEDSRQCPDQPPDTSNSVINEKKPHGLRVSRSTPFAVQFHLVAVTSTIMGPILAQVTLQIPWGSLAMIWGSINCGKSTFLKCIIGETKLDSGIVTVGTKSIAYCDQEPWLQNRTLRENVIGALEYVEAWYLEVLACCGLDIDILALASGDQFLTGTSGCNLSGGQKQRVSLARALYPRTDIIVVDDVLSALDLATAQFVFTKVFSRDGLVRRWNCTVIMTTNRLHFLDDAELVFRMYKGGRIQQEQQGQHEVSDGSASGSVSDYEGDGNSDDVANAADTPHKGRTAPGMSEPPSVTPLAEDLELKNAREKRKYGDWSLYSYLFRSVNVFLIFSWVCFNAIAAFIQAMPQIFVRIWYGRDAGNQYYFIGYVAFSIGTVFCNGLISAQFIRQIAPQFSEELHYRLTRTVMFATLEYLSQHDAGNLLNRFSQDISLISQGLPMIFIQFVYLCFSVLVEIGIIAAGCPYASPIMILILVVMSFVQFFYLRTSRQLRILELESTSSLFTHFTETSSGIQHIRSFGWQSKFLNELSIALNRAQKPYYFLYCCQRWLLLVLDLTSAAAASSLAGLSLSLPHETSSSAVGLALLVLISFSTTASTLIRSWTDLETGLGAIHRIKEACEQTPVEKDTLSGPDLALDWPSHGRLDFNCVSATYQAEEGIIQRALDNVTLTIRPGEKVGISGRTGSGKSSMLMAVLRMADFTGTISIDGRNTTSIPRELLRSRITTMTQDGVELKGSVRLNLYPFAGPQPADTLIVSVLEAIGLWAYISRHGGLQENITKMAFSASQRQLLFLARGILHQETMDTKIVLMDEATSAMDRDANTELQTVIDEAFAECTVLQIAHNEHSFRDADVRVHLDRGAVVSVQRRRQNGQWAPVLSGNHLTADAFVSQMHETSSGIAGEQPTEQRWPELAELPQLENVLAKPHSICELPSHPRAYELPS